jgi:single-strand DNA-binding protein
MKVAFYTLAVDRGKKKDGTDAGADFIPVKCFDKRADFAERYLHRGTKLIVSGKIQTGSYTDRDGRTVYTTEIMAEGQEFAESKAQTEQNMVERPAEPVDEFINIPDSVEDEGLPFS